MPLQHRYRPKDLKRVIGNETVIASLDSVLNRKEDLPHAFLFTGPSGTGKTTLARITARRLGCARADFSELDSADFRGIETVREIRRRSHFMPTSGPCRVWLLDECHQLTKDAQEALLKGLEDSPEHSFFILATTEPEKLKETLIRRCAVFNLAPIETRKIVSLLTNVNKAEGGRVPEEILQDIATDSMGSPGIALAVLDRIVGLDPEQMEEAAKQEMARRNEVILLFRALKNRSPWSKVCEILKGIKQEPEQVRRGVLGYMSAVLLSHDDPQALRILNAFSRNFFDTGRAGLITACYMSVSRSDDR